MEYRKLGNSNLNVSALCLGTMTWGEQNTEEQAHQQLDYATDKGINFIDAAEMYPVPPKPETEGLTESFLGSWLARQPARERLIIATKAAGPAQWLSHIRGGPRLSESHLNEAVDASLRRLQTDYSDLYQWHWPERATNYFGQLGFVAQKEEGHIELLETLKAIKSLLASGKIRHYGLSNETAWGVMHCTRLADELGMPRPLSIQNPYNLLNRSFEVGLAECAHREQVGLLAYSPLAFGVLSGKYLNGARPEGARLTLYQRFSRYTHAHAEAAVSAYQSLADEFGLSLTQMALAFVNAREFVASNIIGATTMAQLEENIGSIDVELSPELLRELERIHAQFTYPCP